MTVAEIIAEVRGYLRDRNGRLMSEADYLARVKSAYKLLRQRALNLNEDSIATSLAVTIPAATTTIALVTLNAALTNLLRIIVIYDENGLPVNFSHVTEQGWFAGYTGTTDSSLSPRSIIIYGGNIKIMPSPTAALAYTFWYVAATETLTAASTPALLPDFHTLIALRAAIEAKKILGADAKDLEGMAFEEEQEFLSWLHSRRQGLPRGLELPFNDQQLG